MDHLKIIFNSFLWMWLFQDNVNKKNKAFGQQRFYFSVMFLFALFLSISLNCFLGTKHKKLNELTLFLIISIVIQAASGITLIQKAIFPVRNGCVHVQ